jgi:hypothetical protein
MALEDLGVMEMLAPSLFSEEEGIEKPSTELWYRALRQSGMKSSEALHIGDEFEAYGFSCMSQHTLTVPLSETIWEQKLQV